MATIVNIQDRETFELALKQISTAQVVVFDTETNGLNWYGNAQIIGISVYLPEIDTAWNFPFRHGIGSEGSAYNRETFADMRVGAAGWDQQFGDYWYSRHYAELADSNHWENLPLSYLAELRSVWAKPGVLYIGHNAKFDLHFLRKEGFSDPADVYDTTVTMHMVWEDWNRTTFHMPDTGEKERGSAGLKWLSRFFKLYKEGEVNGEDELKKNLRQFIGRLAQFAVYDWRDPVNARLLTKQFKDVLKGKRPDPFLDIENGTETIEELTAAVEKKINKAFQATETKVQKNLWRLPSSAVAYYAAMDVVLTWRLYQKGLETIRRWDQEALHIQKQAEMYRLSYRMERNGVRLNIARTEQEHDRTAAQIERVAAEIQRRLWVAINESGLLDSLTLEESLELSEFVGNFNPASPKQLLRAFSITGLNISSTAVKVLREHEDNPLVGQVLRYRRLQKVASTYLAGWLRAVDNDGIVHPGMHTTGTVSGRWSSRGDAGNWQNIPERGGYDIKTNVIPYSDEWGILAIDYGQLEARFAAWWAETVLDLDPNWTMTKLFNSGADMHSYTRDSADIRTVLYPGWSDEAIVVARGYSLEKLAEEGVLPANKVASELRQVGKTMNFGLLYSGGKRMLATLLRTDEYSADILVQRWRQLFPAFPKANAHFKNEALRRRPNPAGYGSFLYIQKPLLVGGGVRKFDHYLPSIWNKKQGWYNQQDYKAGKAWNNFVQGGSGDMVNASGLRIADEFSNDILRPFAQIHDALEFGIRLDHLHIVPRMVEILLDWDTNPRMTVDVSFSKANWQHLKKIADMDKWVRTNGTEGFAV